MRKPQKVTLIFRDGRELTFDSLTKAWLYSGISPGLLKKLALVGYGKPYFGKAKCAVRLEQDK